MNITLLRFVSGYNSVLIFVYALSQKSRAKILLIAKEKVTKAAWHRDWWSVLN